MGAVFINYRGADSQTAAALIDRELAARFGGDRVFLDSRSIAAGADVAGEPLARLRASSVLLVVIGPRWLTLTDGTGRRLVDDPRDRLRREIAGALSLGLRVIPVLTDGVELPTEDELPAEIAGLSRRQYVPLRSRYTGVDLAYLAERIEEADPQLAAAARRHRPGPVPVPRQLPAAPSRFTGRAAELDALTAALEADPTAGATTVISAIGGAGGMGKSWLALHWAHRHAERFPDGQLFVNLRGFDPAGAPVPAKVALGGFLGALGAEPSAMPVDEDARAALYRSLMADRRMLVVLDNARDSAQVAPLLPAGPACTVLVTSRRRLTGLVTTHGARSLDLDVLPEPEARRLLADHLGPGRLAEDPDAVAELLSCCAGLPLALAIVAARATVNPGFPLGVLAAELRGHATRLDGLDAGEIPLDLRAVISWSYQGIGAGAGTLFGLLGVAPGPDIGAAAAASLLGQPAQEARALLRELESAYLVSQPVPGRYRMHDLIRIYAAERAERDQPAASRDTALRRLVDFYLHTAHGGDVLLEPSRPPVELDPPAAGCHPHPLADAGAAMRWFGAEHACLLAAQRLATNHGWHRSVMQLAWAMTTFHWRRGHLPEQLGAWQAALGSARLLGDPAASLAAHRLLGHASARAGRNAEALDHLGHALELAVETGDRLTQAHTHAALTVAWEQHGDHERALENAASALRLYRGLGQPVWEAEQLNSVGWFQARLGRHDEAGTNCQAALDLFRQHHDEEGEAAALDSLGYIAQHTGDHDRAADYYGQARKRYHDLGNSYSEADTLDRLGQVHAASGDAGQARHAWQQALARYQEQRRNDNAQRVRRSLDGLDGPR